ncbi:MAG: PQQ-dependent sugar dehydrogenase [Deltaproteobacteria bacterium]|nr:PQQ-dependent sugar dehydrogenase [Deltaproteobacteria bacterium]MBW2361061.1 PQQ-dependent sugar dehydrogenase [Deltaproteobacteria bacterium]
MRHCFPTALALLAVLAMGACRWVLPERFAVNAPLLNMLFGGGIEAPDTATVPELFETPPGLNVGLYASGLANPRMLRPTPGGHLLVSLSRAGQIVLLEPDRDGDGLPDGRRVLLEELAGPNSLELHEGWLVIGVGDGVARVRFDPQTGETSGELESLVSGLPTGGNHWTRTARYGPDGHLYVTIGSSCNACIEDDPRRAAMLRYAADGSGEEIYATGLRNSVGFDWHPVTGALYATDNGRDLLGNDFPPCELNRVVHGGFYGWPFVNGDGIADPDLGAEPDPRIPEARPPEFGFRAHNAPLGITFVRNPAAPAWLRGAALVALHGSWNRTSKDGYKVVSLHWQADGSVVERDFLTGFLTGEEVIGRPVDVAEGPDGSLFVSDDYAGAIYRVTAGAASARGTAPTAATVLAARAPTAEPEALALGAALYEEFACAGCHETERAVEGVVPVPLKELGQRYSQASLAAFLERPTPPMPFFPMEDRERAALASHLLQTDR